MGLRVGQPAFAVRSFADAPEAGAAEPEKKEESAKETAKENPLEKELADWKEKAKDANDKYLRSLADAVCISLLCVFILV